MEAYLHDTEKLIQFFQFKESDPSPADITLNDLQQFVQWIHELGMSATSQARII